MVWLKRTFSVVLSTEGGQTDEDEKEWRLEHLLECMASRGYSPTKVLVKALSGSPYTLTGSPFAPAPALPTLTNGTMHAAIAPLPLNLDKKLTEAERVVTPRKRTLEQVEEESCSIAGSAQEAVIASLQERSARMEETRNYHGGSDLYGRGYS